jgi:hypothetical protein
MRFTNWHNGKVHRIPKDPMYLSIVMLLESVNGKRLA